MTEKIIDDLSFKLLISSIALNTKSVNETKEEIKLYIKKVLELNEEVYELKDRIERLEKIANTTV